MSLSQLPSSLISTSSFEPSISHLLISQQLSHLSFVKIPSLQTHKSNLLIFALSISGVYKLVSYGIPFTFGLTSPVGEIGCMVTVPFEYTYMYNAGNLLLVAISIDRVLLVSMDYSKYMYVKMITKSRLILTVGICFVLGQIPTVFYLSFWNYAKRNNANAAGINFVEVCLFPAIRLKGYSIFVSAWGYFLPLFLVGIIFSIIFFELLLIRINKNRKVAPELQYPNSNRGNVGENREVIPRPTEEASHDTIKKRYIKPAVTLAALVSAMGISLLPNCIYLVVEAMTGSLNADIRYIMWLILQLIPFLDPLFFAATQKGISEY